MNNRCRFFDLVRPNQINSIGVSVERRLCCGEGMGPTEIEASDSRQVSGDFAMFNRYAILGDWEDSPGAELGNSLHASF
jgi:hypothetical protein